MAEEREAEDSPITWTNEWPCSSLKETVLENVSCSSIRKYGEEKENQFFFFKYRWLCVAKKIWISLGSPFQKMILPSCKYEKKESIAPAHAAVAIIGCFFAQLIPPKTSFTVGRKDTAAD